MTAQVSLFYSKANFFCDLCSLYLMWEQKEISRLNGLAHVILYKLGKKLEVSNQGYIEAKWKEKNLGLNPFEKSSSWSLFKRDEQVITLSWRTEKTLHFLCDDLVTKGKDRPLIAAICVLASLYLLDRYPVLCPLLGGFIITVITLYKILD